VSHTKPADIVAAVRKLLFDHHAYGTGEGRVCIDVDMDAFVRLVTLMSQDEVAK